LGLVGGIMLVLCWIGILPVSRCRSSWPYPDWGGACMIPTVVLLMIPCSCWLELTDRG